MSHWLASKRRGRNSQQRAGEGSASKHTARSHSIPLWWRRRGPLNEYAESAFGSDLQFLSGREMTKYLPNDQNVIGVWRYVPTLLNVLMFLANQGGRMSPQWIRPFENVEISARGLGGVHALFSALLLPFGFHKKRE